MPTNYVDVDKLVNEFEYFEQDAQEYTDEQLDKLEGEIYE